MELKRIYEKYASLAIYCFEFSIVVIALAFKILYSLDVSKTIAALGAILITAIYTLIYLVLVDTITKKNVKRYLVNVEYPILEVKMCDSLRYVKHEDYIDVKIIITNLKVFGREL